MTRGVGWGAGICYCNYYEQQSHRHHYHWQFRLSASSYEQLLLIQLLHNAGQTRAVDMSQPISQAQGARNLCEMRKSELMKHAAGPGVETRRRGPDGKKHVYRSMG